MKYDYAERLDKMGKQFSGEVAKITYMFADIRKLLEEAEHRIRNQDMLIDWQKKKIEELEKEGN